MTARISFVVLAHVNPRQVGRLVTDLGPERVLLHLDSGLDDQTHADLVDATRGATLLPRRRSAWASWTLVEAMVDGLRTALTERDVTHIAVLSGQDRPLLPVDEIEARLGDHSELRPNPLPRPFYGRTGGFDRLQWFNRPVAGRRVAVPARRRLPAGLVAHAAPPWAVLTRRHAETVVREAEAHGAWWRWTWVPDELFVATVLGTRHPGETSMRDRWVADWNPGAAHPRTITTSDVDRVAARAPGAWFARKLDDESGVVTAALDTPAAQARPMS